jgi:hypothetical protein
MIARTTTSVPALGELSLPQQNPNYGANHLHCITSNAYSRARVFDSDRFKLNFAKTLNELTSELAGGEDLKQMWIPGSNNRPALIRRGS